MPSYNYRGYVPQQQNLTYVESSSKYLGGVPTAETSYKHDQFRKGQAGYQPILQYQMNMSRVSSSNQIAKADQTIMQTITTDHQGKQRGMKSSQQQHEVDEQLNYSYSKGVAVNKPRYQQNSAYGNTESSRNGKEGPVIQKNRSSQSLQGQMVRNDSVTSSKKNLEPPSVQTTIVSQSNHGIVIQYPMTKSSNQIPKKVPIKHQLPVTI